jgi:hypothetical protein
MVGGEVYIGDGTRVCMEGMLDRRPPTVMVEIPHQSFLIGSTDDPVVSGCKRGPLHVCWRPLLLVCEMSRRRVGRVEVDDVQSLGAGHVSNIQIDCSGITHDARTTSLPLGLIEAEPTVSLTRIWTSLSKVGLWKALRTSWIEGLRLELSIARSLSFTGAHAQRLRSESQTGCGGWSSIKGWLVTALRDYDGDRFHAPLYNHHCIHSFLSYHYYLSLLLITTT